MCKNSKDDEGYAKTPITPEVLCLMKSLIIAGADVNGRSSFHNGAFKSSLFIAARDRRSDVVCLLLSKRADANLADEWNDTPLAMAKLCLRGRPDPAIVQYLLNARANPN